MTANYYANGNATVTTTATLIGIFPAESGSTPIPPGTTVLVKNSGPEPVYLGDSEVTAGVTSSNGGHLVAPGERLELPAPIDTTTQYSLYGITSSGTAVVQYLLIGAVY